MLVGRCSWELSGRKPTPEEKKVWFARCWTPLNPICLRLSNFHFQIINLPSENIRGSIRRAYR
jgi:hypothetical protein